MGQFINDVKVDVDYDNGIDKHFIFKIIASDKAEVIATVNEGLKQKIAEGEISSQNLRGIEISSDDSRGFFSKLVGDVKGLLNSL